MSSFSLCFSMSCDLCEQVQPTSLDVFGMPRTRTLRLAQ